MKAIIFARVSSKEQEDTGYSLDSQVNLLKEYAEKNHYQVVKTFRISESASGKQIRKTYNEMVQHASAKNIPVILVEKIDRLTRNLKDASVMDDWVKEDTKREIHFVKESFVLNAFTRAHENLVWDMKVAIARFYTNNLSEEVRKGQKEKIAQGWLPTKPPIGYKTVGEQGRKIHIINEAVAPYIRTMFEKYASGNYSLMQLMKVMYQEGLRSRTGGRIGKSRIHDLLSDPFYYGKMRWLGKIYNGAHEPIITKELFDAVQTKLVRKISNPQYRKHKPVFKAKLTCEECSGTITWEIQKQRWYGHCNHYRECSQKKYVRQDKVEEQLFPLFDKVAPKKARVLEWLERALKDSHKDKIEHHTKQREHLNTLIARLDKRLEALYEDKLDGKITLEFYDKKSQDWSSERDDLMESLQGLGEANNAYYQAGFAVHELALKAKSIYQSTEATVDDKRLLLSQTFVSMSLNEKRVTADYTKAFEFLVEWMPKVNKIFEPHLNTVKSLGNSPITHTSTKTSKDYMFEPLLNFRTDKNGSVEMHNTLSRAESKVLLRIVNDVRTIFQRQNGYVYIPDLSSRGQI